MKRKAIDIPCLGYSVKADWYEGKSKGKIAFVVPGFFSTRERYRHFAENVMQRSDVSMLVIELSGHAEGSIFPIEEVTPAQNFLETITAYDWLVAQHPDNKVAVIGSSFGGFLSAQLAKYRQFDTLILRVPAMYRPEDFYTKWDLEEIKNPKSASRAYRSDPENFKDHPLLTRAKKFSGTVYVQVHELDEACPPATTDAFIEAFKPKEVHLAKGFKHGFAESNVSEKQLSDYYDVLAGWLNT